MSQSMMRKAQPFTIGTRLSIPKCPDLPTCVPGAEALDGASMSQNLSDRVSHYLAQANSSPCRFSPPQRQTVHSGGSMDDHNGSLARSIKKITLSRHKDVSYREGTVRLSPRVLAKNSHGNFNNNNSRGLRHFSPDAVEIPCDWNMRNPWSATAVDCNASVTTYAKCAGIPHDSTQSNSAPSSGSVPTRGRHSLETDSLIAQLSLDIKQAEIWVRGKLQELNDQCDICSLQDWDRGALSVQGDITDFESTIMKLSQMEERLSRSQTSNAATIRTQLQTLKEQWQQLKLTATNQNKAVGGAKALLEFNKKADELEIWMREKEEIPPLSVLLDENFDKMQLTRRILDLKQDQLYYRNLQENINGLAQKLEKQGRAESKGTSNRRKHLNRMWLRLQTSLEEHHQSLQLALEAATLWQQADAILRAMEEKRNSATARNGGRRDQDLREIASQIMVLDITVSQVCSLHPVLASRALHKQRQVKESWAQLQQTVRKERSSRVTFTREPGFSVTTDSEDQSIVGNKAQRILGCQKAETNNRDFNIQTPLNSPPEAQTEREVISVTPPESKREDSSLTDREQSQGPHNGLPQRPPSASETEADHLLNELSSTTQWLQSVELLLSEPTAMRSPELVRRDLRQVSILEKEVKTRGLALHCLGGKARRLRLPDCTMSEETQVKVLEVEERFQIVQEALQRRASDLRDTLVLSEFMKVVQMEEERKKKETPAAGGTVRGEHDSSAVASDRPERFTPLEDLQEAVEMLNDAVKERERAVAASKEITDLESRLSALSHMIASVRSRLQDVRRQVEAAEQDFTAVKKQTDLRDLQEMFIQQQQIEMDMFGAISEELKKLDEGRGRLQELCPARSETVGRSIEEILQACSHLKGRIQENQARLQRTARLREFFLSYLGMISWTEDMRSQVLSENPGVVPGRREELEKSIEEKLKEFEVLAGIGWNLIGEDHRLSQMIKERLEELQGMLSWVLMRWRCQKQQRGNKAQRLKTAEVLEATKVLKDELHHTDRSVTAEAIQWPKDEDTTQTSSLPRGPPLRRYRKKALSPMLFQHPLCRLSDNLDMEPEDGAELQEDSPRKRLDGPLWLEPKVLPTGSETPEPEKEPLMPPPSKSFWKRCQGLLDGTIRSLKRKKRVSLPVAEEVSTYLNVKDSERYNTCQSLTVPRLSRKTRSSEQYSLSPSYGSPSNSFPKIRSHLHFKSLKRKEKAQRLTVQGIMEVYSDRKVNTKESIKYQTSTWPPKLAKKSQTLGPHPDFETFRNYVKNPLTKHIDAECIVSGSHLMKSEVNSSNPNIPTAHPSCQRLTLGSILTLKLTKELNLLDNNQEMITVESKHGTEFTSVSDSVGKDESQGKVKEPVKNQDQCNITIKDTRSSGSTSWIEALASSSGYCRQNIHGYGKSTDSLQTWASEDMSDDFINFEIDRLSSIVLQNLEPEWATQRASVNLSEKQDVILANVNVSDSQHINQNETAIYRSSICHETGQKVHGVETYTDNKHEQLRSNCSSLNFLNMTVKTSSPVHEALPESRSFDKANPGSFPEVLHPDHEFLEHDDEELESIWNNARKDHIGRPAQISHNASLKETAKGNLSLLKRPEPCGQVVMSAEPNLLVATFTLPSSAVLATGSVREKGPDPGEEIGVGQSSSIVAACVDSYLEGGSETISEQGPLSTKLETAEEETDTSSSMVTWKLDFQLMEGPLEKKAILQPGGKKASCRTWGVFYAVLVRRTLCFYHDRKHSTKSFVSSPPLHLTGAVCTPESDYAKRSNCFRLRLMDGSEYLFRAPTSELLQEWILKVRHNSGMEDTDLLGDSVLGTRLTPCHVPRDDPLSPWKTNLCRPIPVQGRDMVELPHQKEPKNVQADDCRPSTGPQLPSTFYVSENTDPEHDSNLTTNRRRSRSFSSVMYQKVTSVTSPQETSPSYSVTLYIDEPLTPRGRCHSFATSHTSHTADLKPRNKSVFRKLFRKKE